MSLRPSKKKKKTRQKSKSKKSKLLNKHLSRKFVTRVLSLFYPPLKANYELIHGGSFTFYVKHRVGSIDVLRLNTQGLSHERHTERSMQRQTTYTHLAVYYLRTHTYVSASLPNMYTAGDTLEPLLGRDRATCRFP